MADPRERLVECRATEASGLHAPSSCFRHAAIALLAIGAGLWAIGARSLRAEDWPQFRGPNASGVAASTYPLPVQFSASRQGK